jgi:hypothetical protein
MIKQKRLFGLIMTFVLIISSLSITALAEEGVVAGVFNIDANSKWQGSVFGDVGGQDKITTENFKVSENADETVTLGVENNRGKISGSTEGIAYYFQELPEDANFELSAKVQVDAWTANNQVAFGLMLRSNTLDNVSESSFTGDYLAVGALDQVMKGFYKYEGENVQKLGLEFDANVPSATETYDLSIQKSGDLYILVIGDETKIIDDYTGNIKYAGLFASRNATVTYSDVSLVVEGHVELGDWKDSIFGDVGGQDKISEENFTVNNNTDGTLTLGVANNRGKISSSSEGISYYFKEIPKNVNFEIKTTVQVDEWTANNQVSFGLMLRGNILDNVSDGSFTSDYVALGALDQVIKGFYKYEDSNVQKADYEFDVNVPAPNETYDLSIQKTGSLYVLKVGDETKILTDYTGDIRYAGLYVSRNATVTFSDFDVIVDNRIVDEIKVDSGEMKTDFLLEQELDLTGLKVTAVYQDGSESVLSQSDYLVTDFDSTETGINTITINYNGKGATLDLLIVPLTCTELELVYYPAKTTYYKGDAFDSEGFVVKGIYNDGYKTAELTDEQYQLSVNGQSITDGSYTFETSGTKTITVTSTETPATKITFEVEVKDANITDLDVKKNPEQTLYFLGDELDVDGMVVYAKYDDNSEVRLLSNEYEVAPLDTTTPGEKEIVISHKGKTAAVDVVVKEKELKGIEVTNYPKTTYYTGETLAFEDIEVSLVYDNGDREILSEDDYQIKTASFDNAQAGTYDLSIVPSNATIEPITLKVTVRDAVATEWNSIRFGQSTSDTKNIITYNEDGSILIEAIDGAGKITGDHDGISYYYTVIDAEDNFELSADIKVIEYAKNPHDGQESFGIMARDALGTAGDSSVFSSNIAAIGGYSGGTKEANGTQLYVRTGVVAPDGEGSQGVSKIMVNEERPSEDNSYPVADYRLTLSKTNSGFTGKLNDGEEVIFYEPEILKVQDSKIYVGFYTARVATIEVSNIEFSVTSAATDAPKVEPPAEAVTPDFEILSLDKTSLTEYSLKIRPNVNGTIIVKEDLNVVAQDVDVAAGKTFDLPVTIKDNANTNFSITFIPENTQFLTSYDKIVKNYTVEMKTYAEDGDIYVSPTGTSAGDGTLEKPLDLDTAIDFVRPGQTIIVLDGHYVRNSSLQIRQYNDGTEDAMKYLVAEEGARPVIDFDKKSEGVVHSGNYWHIKGLDFARSAGNTKGYTVGGSHNIIEDSRFYEHGDTGLQISRTDSSQVDMASWPSYNLILNSVSFDNRDPSDNNADGFAAKLTSGEGNIFRGCIAHNNIDDGWDLYTKVGTGAIGAVIIENSIAYDNGFLTDGTVGDGDKNGFKLGGEGVHVPHIIRNSLAFGNGADGFTSNSNPGVIAENNISFNNGTNLNFYTYTNIPTDFTLNGFVSYYTQNMNKDVYPEGLESVMNYLSNGEVITNASGETITYEEVMEKIKEILKAVYGE